MYVPGNTGNVVLFGSSIHCEVGLNEMKLYAKIKRNGKWTMVPAGSIGQRVDAHDRCECRVCAWMKGGLYEEE